MYFLYLVFIHSLYLFKNNDRWTLLLSSDTACTAQDCFKDRRTRRPLLLSDTEKYNIYAAQRNTKKRKNDIKVKKQYKINTVQYSNTIQTEKYENKWTAQTLANDF